MCITLKGMFFMNGENFLIVSKINYRISNFSKAININ